MKLIWPSHEYLPSYVAALERGWSPDNVRGDAATREELAHTAADPETFLARLVDREAAEFADRFHGRHDGSASAGLQQVVVGR